MLPWDLLGTLLSPEPEKQSGFVFKAPFFDTFLTLKVSRKTAHF